MTTPKIPRVSVLFPARDARPFVAEALESVLGQSLVDLELIAVDDGSRDGTREILADAARRDPRVQVVAGSGTGLVDALNLGIGHCRAPFIARMDADDLALPNRLEKQLALLEADPTLAAVGSRVEIFPREQMTVGLKSYEAWLNGIVSAQDVRREAFVESPLVHPAAMVRAEILRAVGGYHDEGWPEDYALWLELLSRGFELASVPEVLLQWRDRPERLTRTHAAYSPEAILRLKARYLAKGPLRGRKCILWGAGKTGRALRRALQIEQVSVELFVDIDPSKIGRPLHGVPVVAPVGLRGFEGVPLVAAVGAKGARALIREHLAEKGWQEISQFTCVG